MTQTNKTQGTWYQSEYELRHWQFIKLFLGLAGVSSLGYLIYIILK